MARRIRESTKLSGGWKEKEGERAMKGDERREEERGIVTHRGRGNKVKCVPCV